jgi:hypothetical protein
VDAGRRLTLPPVVLGALDVRPGQQVQAVGVLDTGELHLVATADALQIFTERRFGNLFAGRVQARLP